MSRTTLPILLLLLSASPGFSDQLHTVANGRSVVVKQDGEWQLAAQSDLLAEKLRTSGEAADPFDLTSGDGAMVIPEATEFPARKDNVPVVLAVGTDRSFDLRAVRWGMTAKEIKGSETARLIHETDTSLSFKVMVTGITTAVKYTISEGKLASAAITITQTRTPDTTFYKGFDALILHFCKFHGEPTVRDYAWKNESYKNDASRWGLAIAWGHLTCRLAWQSLRTKVDLRTSGSGGKFTTVVEFRPPLLTP